MKQLILGTAQFGSRYGISNQNQKISLSETRSVLNCGIKNKINFLDTAISYGRSEEILGKIGVGEYKIISKLPKIPSNISDVFLWVINQTQSSIKRLNVKSLYGVLLHHPSDLVGKHSSHLIKALDTLKSIGLVNKIGISIYDPKELDRYFSLLNIDIVQAPLNIIDRRLILSGWLSKLHNNKVEIHIRSIFLQGLLLMQRNNIPSKFKKWSKIWDEWHYKLSKYQLNPIQVCLNDSMSLPEVNCIIVGVNNTNQLKEIILASKRKLINHDWSFMASSDQMLISPYNWNFL